MLCHLPTEGHSLRSSAISNSIKLLYFALIFDPQQLWGLDKVWGTREVRFHLAPYLKSSRLYAGDPYIWHSHSFDHSLYINLRRQKWWNQISAIDSINITPALLTPPLHPGKKKHDLIPCQCTGSPFLCIPPAQKTVSTSILFLNVWATLCLAVLQFLWFSFELALLKGQLHSHSVVHTPTEEVQSKSSSFPLLGCFTGG